MGVETVGLARRVGGHPLVEVGAAGGEDTDTAIDIGVWLTALRDGGADVQGRDIGVVVFGADGEVHVDHLEIFLRAGFVLEFGLEVGQEGIATVLDREGGRGALRHCVGGMEVDIQGVAVDGIVEAHHGLVAAAETECIPLDAAGAVRVVESKLAARGAVGHIGDGGFLDDGWFDLANQRDGVDRHGDKLAVGSVAHAQLVAAGGIKPLGGEIDRLVDIGKVARDMVAGGIAEGDAVDAVAQRVEDDEGDLDGAFGIVDGVGYAAGAVDVAVGEVAFLDPDPRGVVVLVEEAVDHRHLLP